MEEKKDRNIVSSDEQFMRQALVEAEKAADAGEVPIGAVVVAGGRIVARAHNLTETLCDVTAHAEMQAITAAAESLGGKYLTDCTLYVTVEPCPMCAGALGWAQVSRVVWAYGVLPTRNAGFASMLPACSMQRQQPKRECSPTNVRKSYRGSSARNDVSHAD